MNLKHWNRAIIIFAFVLLITLSGIKIVNAESDLYSVEVNIIVVDDEGDCDDEHVCFSMIQDAIDYANDGDTIKVYSGFYRENVKIFKSISLIGINKELKNGNDKDKPVIYGNGDDVVNVSVSWVNINGFEITNSGLYSAGIAVYGTASNTTILNNTIIKNWNGIYLESTYDNSIYSNEFEYNDNKGIDLVNSSKNKIMNGNIFYRNGNNGIFLINSSFNAIEGNVIKQNIGSIYLNNSSNNTVRKNSIQFDNSSTPILLEDSHGNNITGNGVMDWANSGIRLVRSSDNNIEENDFDNLKYYHGSGIYLKYSSNNTIKVNQVSKHNYGVFLSYYSSNNTINSNNITDCAYGIHFFDYCNNNTIDGNHIFGNDWGISLSRWSNNNTMNGNQVINNFEGIRLEVKSSGNTVMNNNLIENRYYDNGVGILIRQGSDNNFIGGNNVSNNDEGIKVYSSNNTIMYNNIIDNKGDGIQLLNSSNNTIMYNNIADNNDFFNFGILIYYHSENNTIKYNKITNNDWGIWLQNFSKNNTIISNNMSYNRYLGIYIYSNSDGNIIFKNNITNNQFGGISMDDSFQNEIIDNHISDNKKIGIWLVKSINNKIKHNNIINNKEGIDLLTSNNNTIEDNIIKNHDKGISVDADSNYNLFFHNKLANSQNVDDEGNNIWYNITLNEGNFWSDYEGKDEDGNGIGDTPYPIPGGINEDRYPLIDTEPPVIKIIKPTNTIYLKNTAQLPFFFPLILGNIKITIEATDVHTCIYYIHLKIGDEIVYNFSNEPYSWMWDEKVLGQFTISIMASDICGNQASDSIKIWKFF